MARRGLASSGLRWALALASALVWTLVFLGAAALGLVLHADLPPLRSALSGALNRSLQGNYPGRIEIASIDQLGPTNASARRVDVFDEHGRRVLTLEGIKLRFRPLQLLESLLLAGNPPWVIEHVRVDRSQVLLVPDAASGEWTLARALAKPAASPARRRARPPQVYSFEAIELGQVGVRMEHPTLGELEANIHHLQGKADLGGEETALEVRRFGAQLRWGERPPLRGTGSLRLLRKGFMSATFHGFLAELELDAAAQLDADTLAARLDIPLALPEQVRRLLPEWPLRAPLTGQLTAQGPFDALALGGHLSAGDSRLELAGQLDLAQLPAAQLSVSGQALDARLIWPEAPATSLDARARVHVSGSPSGTRVRVEAETEPTRVAGARLPGAELDVEIEGGGARARVSTGDARASLEADVVLTPAGAVEVDARARHLDLAAWPELEAKLRGRGDARARLRVADGQLSGELVARLSGLASGPVRLRESRVEAQFTGRLGELGQTHFETSLDGSDVELGPLKLASAKLRSRGPWQRSRVTAELSSGTGARGRISGSLGLAPELELRDLELAWTDPSFSLDARVSSWIVERGALALDAFRVSGKLGSLTGSAQIAPRRLRVKADAERLDTRALARSFNVAEERLSGLLSGHAELSVEPAATRGALSLEVQKLGLGDLSLASVSLNATLEGAQLQASVAALDPALGRLDASATAQLAGSPLESAAWRRATGSASAELQHLPLWPAGVWASRSSPLRDLDGRLDVSLRLERSDPEVAPSAFVQASTRELTFAWAPSAGSTQPAQVFERVQLRGSASLDGPSGNAAAGLQLADAHGALLTSSGSLALDLNALLVEPEAALQELLETPLDALLRLHSRPLSQLPAALGLSELAGSVEATLQLEGSLREPALTLAVQGQQLSGSFADARRAVDVSGIGYYTPNTGQLTAHADVVQAGRRLVAARLEGHVPNPVAPDPVAEGAGPRGVELHAAAMLNGLPLELWPAAARAQLEARLYGSLELETHGGVMSQRAQLEIGDLSALGHALGNGRLSLSNGPTGTHAELRIGSRERYLGLTLRGPAPTAAASRLAGTLIARSFDAASLSPLTSGVLTRLGGELDADLAFSLRPADNYLGIDGQATLTRGSAHLDLLGLEVHDLSARVNARSTPEYTVLLIDPVDARARTRGSRLQGTAELWLAGFRVVNGEAQLALDDVPLSLDGALRGVAQGNIKGRLERAPDHMLLELKIPDLRLELPASSTRSLIGLEPNPDVHVMQSAERAAARPEGALLWKIAFELGDSVRIQRADLDIPLTGRPVLEYRHELRPSGSIEALPGGHLNLFDQTFNIDRARVQLIPDAPSNPRVDLTASWRAPDGTTVYVDITGSARDASVLTRDDRGLQDVERFYLITGSPGGTGRSMTTSGPSDGGPADAAALGQTVALGINELLRESLGNVAVSVATTADDRASYSASVRLSDKLSFQGNFQPASDTSREESANDLTGTLDYRFSRHWSLSTELGTSGGAFDLLWSYRY